MPLRVGDTPQCPACQHHMVVFTGRVKLSQEVKRVACCLWCDATINMPVSQEDLPMNYEPNMKHWQRGDIVIHDADSKTRNMLMSVVGYTRDGLVKTVYINPDYKRTVYKNELRFLHDPARFNIPTVVAKTGVDKS